MFLRSTPTCRFLLVSRLDSSISHKAHAKATKLGIRINVANDLDVTESTQVGPVGPVGPSGITKLELLASSTFLLLVVRHLLLEAMHLFLVAYCF